MQFAQKTNAPVTLDRELWTELYINETPFLYANEDDIWTPAIFISGVDCPVDETRKDKVAEAISEMERVNRYVFVDLSTGILQILQDGDHIKITRNAILTYEG